MQSIKRVNFLFFRKKKRNFLQELKKNLVIKSLAFVPSLVYTFFRFLRFLRFSKKPQKVGYGCMLHTLS